MKPVASLKVSDCVVTDGDCTVSMDRQEGIWLRKSVYTGDLVTDGAIWPFKPMRSFMQVHFEMVNAQIADSN